MEQENSNMFVNNNVKSEFNIVLGDGFHAQSQSQSHAQSSDSRAQAQAQQVDYFLQNETQYNNFMQGLPEQQTHEQQIQPHKDATLEGSIEFKDPFHLDELPLTNPPLYEPDVITGSGRRRISISNGQIGQLIEHSHEDNFGEMIEDTDQSSGQESDQRTPFETSTQSQSPVQPPHTQTQIQTQTPVQIQAHAHAQSHGHTHTPLHVAPNGHGSENILDQSLQPPIQQHVKMPDLPAGAVSMVPCGMVDTMMHHPMRMMELTPAMQHMGMAPHFDVQHPAMKNRLMPGTAAWKRERLLERNRVAASKCRQKKKMAQMQLQKDAEKNASENERLRKRVLYLESTLGKLKGIMRNHVKSCKDPDVSSKLLEDFMKMDEKENGD